MTIRTLAICLTLVFGLAAQGAQAQQQPVFKDHAEMRGILDELMMSRQIKKLMLRFGGGDEMSPEQLDELEARVRTLFPYDLKNVDVLRVEELSNGWSQELYAYYTGLSYVFVVVLLQQREDSVVAINIKFNTDFYEVYDSF